MGENESSLRDPLVRNAYLILVRGEKKELTSERHRIQGSSE